MRYRDDLPENCPPPEAEEITAPRTVYHFVRHIPPARRDFRSTLARHPDRPFPPREQCLAAGLSVFDDLAVCEAWLRRGRFRGSIIAAVALQAGAGTILKTGSPAHYTWWPAADFDIVAHCTRAGP